MSNRTVSVTNKDNGRVVDIRFWDWFSDIPVVDLNGWVNICEICGAAVYGVSAHLEWHIFTVKDVQWDDISNGG